MRSLSVRRSGCSTSVGSRKLAGICDSLQSGNPQQNRDRKLGQSQPRSVGLRAVVGAAGAEEGLEEGGAVIGENA